MIHDEIHSITKQNTEPIIMVLTRRRCNFCKGNGTIPREGEGFHGLWPVCKGDGYVVEWKPVEEVLK